MYINRKGLQFSSNDCFNLDLTLAKIIHTALVKYKEEHLSHPFAGIPHDIYEEYKLDCESGNDEAVALETWYGVLDEMIYAFGQNEPNIMDYEFTFDTHWRTLGNGNHVLESINPTDKAEYERYEKDIQEHNKRVQYGLEKFAKYFHNLWL